MHSVCTDGGCFRELGILDLLCAKRSRLSTNCEAKAGQNELLQSTVVRKIDFASESENTQADLEEMKRHLKEQLGRIANLELQVLAKETVHKCVVGTLLKQVCCAQEPHTSSPHQVERDMKDWITSVPNESPFGKDEIKVPQQDELDIGGTLRNSIRQVVAELEVGPEVGKDEINAPQKDELELRETLRSSNCQGEAEPEEHARDLAHHTEVESEENEIGVKTASEQNIKLRKSRTSVLFHDDAPSEMLAQAFTCSTVGCPRLPWNGVQGQACCRTCTRQHGCDHGPDCNRKWSAQVAEEQAEAVKIVADLRTSMLQETRQDPLDELPQPEMPAEPTRLEELVAAELSQWIYKAHTQDGPGEAQPPLPNIPFVALQAHVVGEDEKMGSVKVALVTADMPNNHKAMFVLFKGTSYMLDLANWNVEHDYEWFGDAASFVHKGAAGIVRNLCFLKVQKSDCFLRHLDDAYKSGVRSLVFAGHSLGGIYAIASLLPVFSELQREGRMGCEFPEDARLLLEHVRCITFGAPMCFGSDPGIAPTSRFLNFAQFVRDRALNFINAGDPCARAWSAANPKDLMLTVADAMKDEVPGMVSGRIAGKVIDFTVQGILARPDFELQVVACSRDFRHLARLRLLSREDKPYLHWKNDFQLTRQGFHDHKMVKYIQRIVDCCYSDNPTYHMYDDDDLGTKLIMPRVRLSRLARQQELLAALAPSLANLLQADAEGKLTDLDQEVTRRMLMGYREKVLKAGNFTLGSAWLGMDDPIGMDIILAAIAKYENTWPKDNDEKERLDSLIHQAETLKQAVELHMLGYPEKEASLKNDEGAPIHLGNDKYVRVGQSDGVGKYYCGRKLGKSAIPGSDGMCGPYNGPQCASCKRFLTSKVSKVSTPSDSSCSPSKSRSFGSQQTVESKLSGKKKESKRVQPM